MKTTPKFQNVISFFRERTHQSNNLEYTIFARASRLRAAEFGSSHFVIVSSRVTITRLQRESSKAFSSHLDKSCCHQPFNGAIILPKSAFHSKKLCTYMKSSAAVLRWNQDFSSLGTEESASFPFANSMFPR